MDQPPVKTIVLDIETGPAPLNELLTVAPVFEAPINFVDPEKIAAKKQEKFMEWARKAPLCATTGRVVAVGMLEYNIGDEENVSEKILVVGEHGDEKEVIKQTFDLIDGARILTWNGYRFDMPFLIRRAWALHAYHNVPVERVVGGRISNDDLHTDLMDAYCLGVRGDMFSLDTVSKSLGVGQKSDRGSQFHEIIKTDRERALSYLRNDLWLTLKVARCMGLD